MTVHDAREDRFGRYFEQFEVGDVYRHWPGHTITEAEDHLFCVPYGEACGRGLERDSADLGDLLVSLETLVETRDPD